MIRTGNLILDVRNARAWIEGKPVWLSTEEFDLLATLASRPGELLTPGKLAVETRGCADARSTRSIDVHVQRIRAALAAGSSFNYVQTVRGFGYRFAQSGTHPRPLDRNPTRRPGRRLRAGENDI